MARILVIDDERSIRNTLREILEYEKYQVEEASSGVEALEKIQTSEFDVILCDIKMPQMDGMEVLRHILPLSDVPVVMISGHGNIETAVEAIKTGAYDYISKPLDLNRLLVTMRNALDRNKLINETRVLRKKVGSSYKMVGDSGSIQEIYSMIDKVAPTNARILITGENGSGKELVARAIYEGSQRSHGPFIEVNCAAIPSELIESQLFGHEKGSFTSAIKQRKGDFELAHGGTIFLDEIGDMSLSAQAKVLRALQENKITRVGGEKEISVDVRVIAATNKNLMEEIQNKNFREDLFHRLSVIIVHIPPLRERIEDIPLLAVHFMDTISESMGKKPLDFGDDANEALKSLKWTGNVRELRNIVERLAILCNKTITADDVNKYTNQSY
ncbi:MAG: sigma-54 dependent transcriptional regulator [Bacteroidales bacterium]|nr:sigma-54 dependent transcriptional regulator [Bacteroidales bacterium]